jgi:hypothetical protein
MGVFFLFSLFSFSLPRTSAFFSYMSFSICCDKWTTFFHLCSTQILVPFSSVKIPSLSLSLCCGVNRWTGVSILVDWSWLFLSRLMLKTWVLVSFIFYCCCR